MKSAPGFYAIIAISTFVGMALNWFGINPIKALYYTAALNGLAAPPLMVLVILLANKKISWASTSTQKRVISLGV